MKPWADDLKNVKCPVTLHHGVLDNWAPLEMSQRLKAVLPQGAELITYNGLGHYSTLYRALPGILTGPVLAGSA